MDQYDSECLLCESDCSHCIDMSKLNINDEESKVSQIESLVQEERDEVSAIKSDIKRLKL